MCRRVMWHVTLGSKFWLFLDVSAVSEQLGRGSIQSVSGWHSASSWEPGNDDILFMTRCLFERAEVFWTRRLQTLPKQIRLQNPT